MSFPQLRGPAHLVDQNVHEYTAYVVFGAAVITSYKGKGFRLTRTGVGIYNVQMGTATDPCAYLRFMRFPRISWQKAAGTNVLGLVTTVITALGTTGLFEIKTVTAAGVATEPTDGNIASIDWALTQDPDNDVVVA